MRLEEAPLLRSSPRYPAELSQFQDALLDEAFRKLFRSHAAGCSVRRNEVEIHESGAFERGKR